MSSTSGQGWQRGRGDDPILPEVLYVLWERRLLVAGFVLILVLAAAFFGLHEGRFYTSEANVSLRPQQGSGTTEDADAFVEGVLGAVTARDFMEEVKREAGWTGNTEEFQRRLDVERYSGAGGAYGLRVRFSGASADEAARSANAYAEVFVARVEQLNDQRLAGGTLAAEASVEEYASAEGWASFRPVALAVAAVVVGILVGGTAALMLESRARSWRSARDAEMTLRAPVIGVIPDYSPEES